ncbi:MAG: YggS family pyridoxal phosphate-dependent enzyme [Flavobacteriales bacterium]
MKSIAERLDSLRRQIPMHVKLVAVSKTKSKDEILEAYHSGQRAFGENYVQEMVAKQPLLPPEIEWHFIGHLQTNKVRSIAPFVQWIHSVDSEKLLAEINTQAAKHHRVIHCLLQVHVAVEETKFGWDNEELTAFCGRADFRQYPFVNIRGIMGMASFSEDEKLVRSEFQVIKKCFEELKTTAFKGKADFTEISMGMSSDWRWAVEEGSSMVRIGSAIFGARN